MPVSCKHKTLQPKRKRAGLINMQGLIWHNKIIRLTYRTCSQKSPLQTHFRRRSSYPKTLHCNDFSSAKSKRCNRQQRRERERQLRRQRQSAETEDRDNRRILRDERMPSDWLSYSLSISDRPLVAKGIDFQIQNTNGENSHFAVSSVSLFL